MIKLPLANSIFKLSAREKLCITRAQTQVRQRHQCLERLLLSALGKHLIDSSFQMSWMWPNNTSNLLAILKCYKSWGSLYTQASRNTNRFIDIHLGKTQLSYVFLAEPFIHWSQTMTGRTPLSPKINNHRQR